MIEFLLLCLLLLLMVLFAAGTWLVQYVLIPGLLLRAFFLSKWAPRELKEVVGWMLGVFTLLLVGGLGWSQHVQVRARKLTWQQQEHEARMAPIRLTVQQPGLLPYPLGRGHIEAFPNDTAQQLVVSGDLPDGQRLQACFTTIRGSSAPFETSAVAVRIGASTATQAVGHSFYAPDSQTVQGEFRCVMPSGKPLAISFPPTPVVRR